MLDFILTKVPRRFQSNCVTGTGLFDFHLIIVMVMSKTIKNVRPRIINYRSFRNFSDKTFRASLMKKLFQNDHGYIH